MTDDDESQVPGRSGNADGLADTLARLGVEPWSPDDVDCRPLLASDVFDDPTPDMVWAGR